MEMTPEPLSRPEHDAKLQASEARMDARMDRLETKMNGMADKMDAMIVTMTDFKMEMREMKGEIRDIRKEMRSWGVGLFATVITTAIAVMIGVWQIVSGVNQANIAAFESGRSVEKATGEAVRSIERILADFEKQQKR